MDNPTTYEQHTKQARKRLFWILISLLLVVSILGGLFLYVACLYNATDYSFILENDDVFSVADGFLFPREDDFVTEKDYVASYNLNTGDLHKYPIETFDMARVGLEGNYSYFRYLPNGETEGDQGKILPASHSALPLSRSNTETSFVFTQEDGKKFLVDTQTLSCTPIFANSTADGVDPYGTKIEEFSHNGLYAVGQEDNHLLIYIRESTKSHAIAKVIKVDLSEYGDDFFYPRFVSESYILLASESTTAGPITLTFYLCNALTGEIQACPRPDNGIYGHEYIFSTGYGQTYLPVTTPDDEHPEDAVLLRYANAATGSITEHKLPLDFRSAYVNTVSPRGEYALFSNFNKEGADKLIFSKAGGRQFSADDLMGDVLNEGEFILSNRVDFLGENIVLITIQSPDNTKRSVVLKLCF